MMSEVTTMKKVTKVLVLAGTMAVFMLGMVGCKKETECESCKQVKESDEYEVEGEDVWLCDDCYALVEALQSLMK